MKRQACLVVFLGACGSSPPSPGASVLELHASPTRFGAYVQPSFTQAAAANLHIDTTFTPGTYTGDVFAQPLYVDNGGPKDMIIAATENNEVVAFSPTGTILWQVTLGTPQPMPNPAGGADCGDVNPLGITGTPVIDLDKKTIYLDAMISDNGAHHRVYALSLENGSTLSGWPIDIGTVVTSPIPFLSAPENQRGGLTIFDGQVWVPYGGHAGDCGDYHGWVVAIPQNDPQHPHAFATQVTQAGFWSPGGLTSDGVSVFGVTGNGAPTSTWGNSEMLARFSSGAAFSGSSTDYWVPTDWMSLDSGDTDQTGPAMPLDLPGSIPEHLIVSFGKNGYVYLTDRDNLGGIGNPVAQLAASSGQIINTSTLYQTAQATYVAFRGPGQNCPDGNPDHNLVAVKIIPGAPPTLAIAWCAGTGPVGSPIATTTDGKADPIVWAVGAEGDQLMHGYDGDTGAVVFAGGGSGNAMTSTSRFISPMVAKGRIFVAADNQLYAFTLE